MLLHSEQINEIATALAKAQGSIKGAIKDSANPHFKSKYADLASCWEACREPLSANGLAVVQMPGQADGVATITTLLTHASGQWMRSDVSVRPAKPDAQGLGSALTYLRRYSLTAMVGIAPEDDDGNAAVADNQSGTKAAPKQAPKPAPMPEDIDIPAEFWDQDILKITKPTLDEWLAHLIASVSAAPTIIAVNDLDRDNSDWITRLKDVDRSRHELLMTLMNARRSFFMDESSKGEAA